MYICFGLCKVVLKQNKPKEKRLFPNKTNEQKLEKIITNNYFFKEHIFKL